VRVVGLYVGTPLGACVAKSSGATGVVKPRREAAASPARSALRPAVSGGESVGKYREGGFKKRIRGGGVCRRNPRPVSISGRPSNR
jgi:hypothetical protein